MFSRFEIPTVVRLAVYDYLYEWQLSAVQIFSLAAVLAPLLILFGLKSGLIDNLTQKLLENPTNREIRAVGSGSFSSEWFSQIKGRKDVAFVIPRTRTIAATIYLRNTDSPKRGVVVADLIPTDEGDPLLLDLPPLPDKNTAIMLSRRAANSLGIVAGKPVDGFVSRTIDGQREVVKLTLEVVAVAPKTAFPRDGVFSDLGLLLAIERYRDGIEVPELKWSGTKAPITPSAFASYRLYASTLDDVSVLSDLLRSQGHEVRTRAAEISIMHSLNRNLTLMFWILAGIGGIGYLISLAAGLWATIQRKHMELSIMRLLGMRAIDIAGFPLCQAMLTSTIGVVVAILVALSISGILNTVFAGRGAPGELVCRLLPLQLLWGGMITIIFGIFASLLPGYRSMLVEPAEGLRQT